MNENTKAKTIEVINTARQVERISLELYGNKINFSFSSAFLM